ncbi:MAG: cupin domain-containing protein [Elusimicrobia bacterium]|nr:cupin domain-containing protein [Elusimicrobiota bacterium]
MPVIKLNDCPEFISGDGAILREMLHPDKADLKLRYSFAHAIVLPGKVTKPHKLKTSEVYFILSGAGVMSIDGEKQKVGAGDTIYIPPNSAQFIENTGKQNLVFICIVDPAWRAEDEVVL